MSATILPFPSAASTPVAPTPASLPGSGHCALDVTAVVPVAIAVEIMRLIEIHGTYGARA